MEQPSFDSQFRGKLIDRYITHWHVAIDEATARRWCQHDHMRWDEVEITRGVELIHATVDFAYWSDGRMTYRVEGVPPGGSLTTDAVSLLTWAANADYTTVEGGMPVLARVGRILSTMPLDARTFQPPRDGLVEKLEVIWTDGEPGILYTWYSGHFEGYDYHVYPSLESLTHSE